jgi:hypothetical protein
MDGTILRTLRTAADRITDELVRLVNELPYVAEGSAQVIDLDTVE